MPKFSCPNPLHALAMLAITALPALAEGFTENGKNTNWYLACPKEGIAAAVPSQASNGRCRQIATAIANGNPPASVWAAMSPAVGREVLNMIDPIHNFLSDQGFRDPNLYNDESSVAVPQYRITLAPQAVLQNKGHGDQAMAFYAQGHIYIGVDPHVTPQGGVDTVELLKTVAHEYFHAIQAAYTGGHSHDEHTEDEATQPRKKKKAGGWLSEGTAEYVALHYEALANGKKYDWQGSFRDFSKSLMDVSDGGYENHVFFALLARIINGRGTGEPGMDGFGLAAASPGYLHRVYSGYSAPLGTLDEDKEAMRWFSAAVQNADPAGRSFQQLYGAVMRDLTYRPDFIGGVFPFMPGAKLVPDEISVKGRPGAGWTQLTKTYQIAPVATHFYEIDAVRLPKGGALGVRVILPEGETTDPANLQLAIHGVSYSTPEKSETHNFGVIEKGNDPVYLSVSNIDAVPYDTDPASYQIELSWLSGGICDYNAIYGSTRIDEQKNAAREIGMPLEVYDAFYPPPSEFQKKYGARGQTNELEGDPTILPDKARLLIRGGMFSLGGDACSHHLAANGLVESGMLGITMGASADAEAQNAVNELPFVSGAARRMSELDRTRREVKDTLEALSMITGGSFFGTDPRDASVVISVFSPDLFGFYHGMPAIVEAGPSIAGRGGWAPNSSGAVNIILPGIRLGDLKKGRSYPAITFAPAGAPGDAMPIAGRWQGSWSEQGPIGEFHSLLAGRLSGVVSITDITAAQVRGDFALRGPGSTRSFTAELQTVNGEDQRVETNLIIADTPVSISGSFSSPTAETGTPIFGHIFGLRSVSRRAELK